MECACLARGRPSPWDSVTCGCGREADPCRRQGHMGKCRGKGPSSHWARADSRQVWALCWPAGVLTLPGPGPSGSQPGAEGLKVSLVKPQRACPSGVGEHSAELTGERRVSVLYSEDPHPQAFEWTLPRNLPAAPGPLPPLCAPGTIPVAGRSCVNFSRAHTHAQHTHRRVRTRRQWLLTAHLWPRGCKDVG